MKLNLVRKKLNWEYKPFEIPKKILGYLERNRKIMVKIKKINGKKIIIRKKIKLKNIFLMTLNQFLKKKK